MKAALDYVNRLRAKARLESYHTLCLSDDDAVGTFRAGISWALDRVKLCRCTVVLRDEQFTHGYLKACEDIKSLLTEKDSHEKDA